MTSNVLNTSESDDRGCDKRVESGINTEEQEESLAKISNFTGTKAWPDLLEPSDFARGWWYTK